MFKRLSQARISLRLPALIVGTLIMTVIVASETYYLQFRKEAELATQQKSQVLTAQVANSLEQWFTSMDQQLETLAEDPNTALSLKLFVDALKSGGTTTLGDARRLYHESNTFPVGELNNLKDAGDGSLYSSVHKKEHGFFDGITNRYGFYDLFLIDPDGDIIYTVYKEADYGTNLIAGAYSASGLGQVFRDAMNGTPDTLSFADFAPYAPSAGAPAAFIARQVTHQDGSVAGVLALQLPQDGPSKVIADIAGLNALDEVYLLGRDTLARTVSRKDNALSLLAPAPETAAGDAVRNQETGYFPHVAGFSGTEAMVTVSDIPVYDETWNVVVELDEETQFSALARLRHTMFIFIGVGLLASGLLGWLMARSITKPLAGFATAMENVANEHYEAKIPNTDRGDELGGVSRILEDFRIKLQQSSEAARLREVANAEQERVVSEISGGLRRLSGGDLTSTIEDPFDRDYEQLRLDFNATVDTLNTLMLSITENATEIRSRADEISGSSDDLSRRTENQAATLEETAAALDELTSSVRSAADGAAEVERVVTEARAEAEQSGKVVNDAVDAMSQIKKSSDEIAQIINVIDDIAFQTNLLALNAGVEAARAGDAGRGFAVVASEVRALAQRSSDAAKQIKTLIGSSTEQVETGVGLVGRAGGALTSIVDRVGQIAQLVSGIAVGAREQSAGLGEINVGVSQLDQVTQQNAAMVQDATAAAMTLKSEASGLSQLVSRFQLSGSSVAPIAPALQPVQSFAATPVPEGHATPAPKAFAVAGNGPTWTDF